MTPSSGIEFLVWLLITAASIAILAEQLKIPYNAMSPGARTVMVSFREYVSFVMNSLVFLLIGLEVHVRELLQDWTSVVVAIGAKRRIRHPFDDQQR